MSAYVTSTDLLNETLGNLGVLSAGQSVDPEDFNYVQAKLEPTIRKIVQLDIIPFPDLDQIPGEWLNDLADILAGECANKFGATPDDFIKMTNKGLGGVNGVDVGSGAAAKSLRAMNRGRPTYETLRGSYF